MVYKVLAFEIHENNVVPLFFIPSCLRSQVYKVPGSWSPCLWSPWCQVGLIIKLEQSPAGYNILQVHPYQSFNHSSLLSSILTFILSLHSSLLHLSSLSSFHFIHPYFHSSLLSFILTFIHPYFHSFLLSSFHFIHPYFHSFIPFNTFLLLSFHSF